MGVGTTAFCSSSWECPGDKKDTSQVETTSIGVEGNFIRSPGTSRVNPECLEDGSGRERGT